MRAVLYSGPSMLDGSPVVLLATDGGENSKTGAMVQTYILRADCDPIDAARRGLDHSVCGNCQHRHVLDGTCYVRLDTGPLQVWRGYQRGIYSRIETPQLSGLLGGRYVRLGSYGDPAAIPFYIWEEVLRGALGVTGYSHQWSVPEFQAFKKFCMASVDNEVQESLARSIGWRTYRIVPTDTGERPDHAMLCPASEQGGRVLTCIECLACGGESSSNKAHVYVPVHGVSFKVKRFNQLISIERGSK